MAVNLSPPGILQFFDNAGRPAAGGSVLTQVGGVNYATYEDSAGTIALPNPIPLNSRGEISNASGASRQLFLVAGQVYTFTVNDINGNLLDTFSYMVGTATGADITNLQSQITAFATSFTTGALTVSGSSTLHAVSATSLSVSGASTLTGGATLGANLAMGANAITGASNITASGTVTAANFATTGAPTINAASFLNGSAVTSGNLVAFDTNGSATGSGITNAAGTITFANVGAYDVFFSGLFKQPTAALNIDTGIYFGGTANTIIGPVSGNTSRLEIAGANGAVWTTGVIRALVVTNAANQTLTVNSTLAFSGTYQLDARAYLVIEQR